MPAGMRDFLKWGNEDYDRFAFPALNKAPIVYLDVRKPVIPRQAASTKPAFSMKLI
jgi:hypothetical protein